MPKNYTLFWIVPTSLLLFMVVVLFMGMWYIYQLPRILYSIVKWPFSERTYYSDWLKD
jgi:hypothetical protein